MFSIMRKLSTHGIFFHFTLTCNDISDFTDVQTLHGNFYKMQNKILHDNLRQTYNIDIPASLEIREPIS